MNKKNAHLFLPLVQALAAGLTIRANRGTRDNPLWVRLEAEDGEVHFSCAPDLYDVDPDELAALVPGEPKAKEPVDVDEMIERVGRVVDRLDNYDAAFDIPMPDETRLKALKFGIPEMRDQLREAIAGAQEGAA